MDKRKRYEEFVLESKGFVEAYKSHIGLSSRVGNDIELSFEDISSFSPNLAESLLESPEETLEIIEKVIKETGIIKHPSVRLKMLPKTCNVSIRQIRSKNLDRLFYTEGIIKQATEIRPLLISVRYECPNCGSILSVNGDVNLDKDPRCVCGYRGPKKVISKQFVDQQRIVIEETTDSLDNVGSQPHKISVLLEGTLADPIFEKRAIPGTRVQVIGILKEIYMDYKGLMKNRHEIVIRANNLISLEDDDEKVNVTEEDIREFKEISLDSNILDRFAQGLAPSVYGYDDIKAAIILQLLGGVRKKKSDGTWIRGSIHGLMVGDASTSKSVLIRNAVDLLPRARFVSGKSASGAGLTATVQRDETSKQWTLEAGTMVLANKSLMGVDEMDKMNDNDRNNMHEAMEAQQISFAKAGIQATLSTQTSVLAAANPKLGRFEKSGGDFNLIKEVNLSVPLLSRFDFIFVIRDTIDIGKDNMIADKILSEHSPVEQEQDLSHEFMRKYITYAKKIEPILTPECIKMIKDFYVAFRQAGKKADVVQIVARQLEGLIRLTQAHAKLRLSNVTTEQDAKAAMKIFRECMKQIGLREDGLIDSAALSGVSTSQRNKVLLVREYLDNKKSQGIQMCNIKDIEKDLKTILPNDLYTALDTLSKNGDVFQPKSGWYQRL